MTMVDVQVKTCKADGLDSKNFEINVNGVLTIWNLSVRYHWDPDYDKHHHDDIDQVLDGRERGASGKPICPLSQPCWMQGRRKARGEYHSFFYLPHSFF